MPACRFLPLMGALLLGACHGAAPQPSEQVNQVAAPAGLASTSTPAPSASARSVDAQKILDENDRAIAENNAMVAALQDYSRQDPAKLSRLTSTCQEKTGGSLADGGAKKVFECIRSSW